MTPYQIFLAFLYFFVVLVVLPTFCSEKVYSVYYEDDPERTEAIERENLEGRRRGVREYLEGVDPEASLAFHEARLSGPLDNLVVVVVVAGGRPRHEEDEALSQLVAEVDRSIRGETFFRSAMLVCDATTTTSSSFAELDRLSRLYPVRRLGKKDNSTSSSSSSRRPPDAEEALRRAFVGCLELGLAASPGFGHATFVRGDGAVLPYGGFLGALNHAARFRLSAAPSRGELAPRAEPWLLLHLREPVALRGYAPAWDSARELALLAAAGAAAFHLLLGPLEGRAWAASAAHALFGALYFLTLALAVGRPYVSELRRLAPPLYRIYEPPAPVPFGAAAAPRAALRPLLTQLRPLRCSAYIPFHEVLDHAVSALGAPALVISPSLFRHVARP